MVTPYEAYTIKHVWIPDERNSIKYYAWEIGQMKHLLEGKIAKDNDDIKQWYNFFLTYAEIGIEVANARLKKYRQQLIDFSMQGTELS
jgi:hypothetical protein